MGGRGLMSASGSHQGSGGSRTELVGRHKSSWVAAEVPRFRLRGTQALVSAGCREMAGKGGCDWSLESRLRTPAWEPVTVVEKTSLPECRSRASPTRPWGPAASTELYKGEDAGNGCRRVDS